MSVALAVVGVALLLVAVGGRAEAAHAQSGPDDEPRYTMALVGVPLSEALEQVIARTQISLAYEPEMVAGRTTFCKAEQAPPGKLLSCVLKNTGLDYVQLSSGTYTLRPDARTEPLYADLSGRVVDAQSGRPLDGAHVLLGTDGQGTAANSNGRFSFPQLKPGHHRVVVTHVGYHNVTDTIYVAPRQERRVALSLAPRVVLSEPIVVNGFEVRLPSKELLAESRTESQLTSAPQVGTPDVVQELGTVAGVRLGNGLSDVHLQGGASGEQQFLLDGVPVFMPVSSGGLISPFSPFALKRVTVRKAGFGAEYGSALSGMIEVDQRVAPSEGDHRLMGRIDPLSANVQWGGRLEGSDDLTASWMITGRHDLWSVHQPDHLQALFGNWSTPDRFLLRALRSPNERSPDAGATGDGGMANRLAVEFTDLHGAAQVEFGNLSSLHLSVYRSANAFGTESVVGPGGSVLFDELEEEDPDGEEGGDAEAADDPPGAEVDGNRTIFKKAYRWRNRMAQVRYEWVPSGQLFLSARLWGSDYRLNRPVSLSAAADSTAPTSDDSDRSVSVQSKEFNEIREVGVRLRADWARPNGHYLSGALAAVRERSDVSLSADPFGASPARFAPFQPVRWRVSGFLEDRVSLGEHIKATLGTRLTYLPGKQTLYGEPRLSVRYDRKTANGGTWAARWAAGLYRQYVHSFDATTYNITSLLPRVRYWFPIGKGQRPPEAYHTTASVLYRPSTPWKLSTEVYYKHQPHLLVLDYGGAPSSTGGSLFQTADGYAYGAAATATRTGEHLRVKAQYDYAIARRRIPDRFGGTFEPVPWNGPHRLQLSVDLTPLPHWTATLRWQGVWGRSWGFRQTYYDFLAPDPKTRRFRPFDLSNPADHRLSPMSRWDLGVAYSREIAGLTLKGRATLINVLGRDNIAGWSLQYAPDKKRYVRSRRRAAPFIPSISLQVSY